MKWLKMAIDTFSTQVLVMRITGKLVRVECSPAAVTGDESRKKPLSRNKFGMGRSGK
jgi:hypothetical protein